MQRHPAPSLSSVRAHWQVIQGSLSWQCWTSSLSALCRPGYADRWRHSVRPGRSVPQRLSRPASIIATALHSRPVRLQPRVNPYLFRSPFAMRAGHAVRAVSCVPLPVPPYPLDGCAASGSGWQFEFLASAYTMLSGPVAENMDCDGTTGPSRRPAGAARRGT